MTWPASSSSPAREPEPSPVVLELARRSLRFLADAQGPTGRTRNRRSANGRWHGRRGVDDCWGRSVWALGTARRAPPATRPTAHGRSSTMPPSSDRAGHGPWPSRRSARPRSSTTTLGHARPGPARRRRDAAPRPRWRRAAGWAWPEARLSYANAALPDALLAAGHTLGRPELVDRGLELLGWLLDRETRDGHLSVTPVGGAGPTDAAPGFDQQPIEVAALADACARAAGLTATPGGSTACGWPAPGSTATTTPAP